ncbi:MAG: lytic polysaccharide monooxygenase, partial [Myxococcales bacterium]|nr:lytic polysaccharide monooxygenase [Myxococcales bacterium]
PCGHPDNPPGEAAPTVYEAGQTITVRFDEFVQHTGYFRVAVDTSGTDGFVSPASFDDFYNSPQVLLDDIADAQDGGLHEVEVTLPDTTCDPCSLQLIQVMTDDGAFGPGTDDLYFQCADIVLVPAGTNGGSGSGDGGSGDGGPGSDGTGAPFTTGMASDTSDATTADSDDEASGCSCRAHRSPAALAWLLVVLAAGRRRRVTAVACRRAGCG